MKFLQIYGEKIGSQRYGLKNLLDILDVEFIAGSTNGYTLQPSIYEISDFNLMLKSLLPN